MQARSCVLPCEWGRALLHLRACLFFVEREPSEGNKIHTKDRGAEGKEGDAN